ncbi:MAG: threonine/serine exporter family protein [Defluviitaleaceae bacterium]|nr:threonine/serine exporter family protein [Defluviitaleaceae bacterium]
MLIYRLVGAFLASFTFGIMFNVQKKELIFCGFTGFLGFLVLEFFQDFPVINIFFATVVVTTTSIVLSKVRKTISTNYLTTGIIPYVPGAALYRTMSHVVFTEWDYALEAGSQVFLTAIAIAFGVIIVVSCYNAIRSNN